MTIFGKTLAFLNLVLSVTTAALIVYVFTTRANWVSAYTDAKTKVETLDAAYKAERASHENDRKQAEATESALRDEKKKSDDALSIAQAQIDQEKRTAQTQTALNNNSATEAKRLQAELEQNKSERTAILEEKESLRNRIIAVQKELDGQRAIAINADLQAKNLVQRVNNLLRNVEELTARNRELEATPGLSTGLGGGGSASVTQETTKAAPPGVRGKVTGVGGETGMAQVNIGSDSGLTAGNVLIVFRGNEYLGDLQITHAEPKAAVGKFVPKSRTAKVQVNDSVITSFSGSPQ
jgi:hypothetical protein